MWSVFFLCVCVAFSCTWNGNQTGAFDSDDDNNYIRNIGVWDGSATQYLMYEYVYYLATNTVTAQSLEGRTISQFYLLFRQEGAVSVRVAYPDRESIILETSFSNNGIDYTVLSNFSPFTYDWNNQLYIRITEDTLFGGVILDVDW